MPRYEGMTTTEQYAVIYPDRAAAIRRHGGKPPAATFPPPDRDIIEEIATGDSLGGTDPTTGRTDRLTRHRAGATSRALAQVAELVDAQVSGTCGRKVVEVRVFSWAPTH